MDYLYSKIEWFADFEENTPKRKAFAEHLKLIVKALHDIEWVDSGDYAPGDENEAIMAVLKGVAEMNDLRQAAQQALEALALCQTDVHWELNSPTRKFLRKAELCLRAALKERNA